MIAVADLLKDRPLPGNYFAPDAYVQGDIEFGLIENRQGARLLALPEVLLQAIYAGLEKETGQAAVLVLFNCGRWWGKNFYRRFGKEVSDYYGKPLAQMEMVEFLQCLKQCWKTHGWGTIDLDLNYYQHGFLVVKVWNSAFAQAAPPSNRPMCFAEAGILSAFFSQLTGRDLHCVQTSCESMGAECNNFVLGLSERLKPVESWLEEEQDHPTIMERLCQNQTSSLDPS
ncbi:MAG: V4R domain-containing protein [Xenococcaceae cyanobacterium]